MAYTLTEIRDELEKALSDTANDIWSTDLLDRCILQALREVSKASPRLTNDYTTATDDTCEYDLSSETNLLGVAQVWYPWDHTDDDYPAYPVPFFMVDEDTVRLNLEEGEISDDYDIRWFFWKEHTINGLDGASASTINDPWLEELVIEGAAAHALEAITVEYINTLTNTVDTVDQFRKEAERRLRLYYAKLATVRREFRGGHVPGWSLDKWDSAS